MIIAERKQLLCSGGKYLFSFDYSKTMGYAYNRMPDGDFCLGLLGIWGKSDGTAVEYRI